MTAERDESAAAGAAGLDAATVFAALGDETRLRILRVLGDAGTTDAREVAYVPFDRPDVRGIAYSTLQERTGVEDNGRLNYHLDHLRGTLVEHGPGGYTLTWPGVLTYRYLVVGVFGDAPVEREFAVEGSCPKCDAGLVARYGRDQVLYVDCADCSKRLCMVHVPRRGAARSETALLRAGAHRFRYWTSSFADGICPWCAGDVDASVTLSSGPGSFVTERLDTPSATFLCRDCSAVYYPGIGSLLLSDAAVVAHCHRFGTDPTSEYPWRVPFAVDADRSEVVHRDPVRVAVTVGPPDDAVRAVVDESLSVTVEER
jgi:hypothetical protein